MSLEREGKGSIRVGTLKKWREEGGRGRRGGREREEIEREREIRKAENDRKKERGGRGRKSGKAGGIKRKKEERK